MGPVPRQVRGLAAALVFAAAAIITVVWCGSMASGMPMPGDWMMSMAWMRMPGQSWPGAAAMFLAMWIVMMTAMMLPSLVPVLLNHRRPMRVACGYFSVWYAAGLVVYPVGVLLAGAEMRWPALSQLVPIATGVVIVLAGVVQLTRWKARELEHCRDRSCCAIGRRPGPRQAWRDGLRIGAHCVRCCGALMAVMLVLGVMNVAAMAIVAAAISAERLGPWPRLTARVLGVAALVAGGVMIAIAP
jgi:predicted metal-binding membrane protein